MFWSKKYHGDAINLVKTECGHGDLEDEESKSQIANGNGNVRCKEFVSEGVSRWKIQINQKSWIIGFVGTKFINMQNSIGLLVCA